MLVRRLIPGFAGAMIALASPGYADGISDGIAKLPGAVEDVRVAGTWQAEGKSGVYRMVIARTGGDAVTARLFVQWIAYGEAGEATLENTNEIVEFATLGLDIIDYVSESDAEGLSAYIEAVDPQGSINDQYELFVFAPDDYRFGPATN